MTNLGYDPIPHLNFHPTKISVENTEIPNQGLAPELPLFTNLLIVAPQAAAAY